MLFLSLLALLFHSAQAEAPPGLQLFCFTEPMSTSFLIETKGVEVQATVIHHYGSEYAPAISGIFTPSDLPTLERRAKFIRQMKPQMTFHWPLKACKNFGEGRFECWGTKDVQEGENGVKFEPFALYSTKVTEEGVAGKLEYLQLTLSVYASPNDNEGGTVEMRYPREGCSANRLRTVAGKP